MPPGAWHLRSPRGHAGIIKEIQGSCAPSQVVREAGIGGQGSWYSFHLTLQAAGIVPATPTRKKNTLAPAALGASSCPDTAEC